MKIYSVLLSILSGILLWLGWPTYGFAGLLFIAFVPLLLSRDRIEKSQSQKKSLKVWVHAYLTFFIWNVATTWWLYNSTPFGMWFAVLANSLLMSLVFLFYHFIARKTSNFSSLAFLIALWISFEKMHLLWDFSWPWLNLGNGFSEYTSWVQWYEYTGVHGGSLWIWVINGLLYAIVLRFHAVAKRSRSESRIKPTITHLLKRVILPIALIIIPIVISLIIKPVDQIADKTTIEVVILQPNVDPYNEKYTASNNRTMQDLIQLADSAVTSQTRFIIAPETVLGTNIKRSRLTYDSSTILIRNYLRTHDDLNYIGGVALFDKFYNEERATIQSNYVQQGDFYFNDYNSAVFLDKSDSIKTYHKSKLVVGVENFPYKNILQPLLGDAMIDLGGTVATKTTQENRAIFKTADSIAVAPVICYESVYGNYVSGYVKNGAQFLAIITNDAWWGNTQGHKQHLSLARLRAIENRKWIARSANTGISAIINTAGTIISKTEYNTKAAITGTVIPNSTMTFYAKHGDFIARVAQFLALGIFLFSFTKRGKMSRK